VTATHYEVSTNPTEAVLKIDGWAGPPSPSELEFMPTLVVYGDGRVVDPGYSESLVPELYQYHVSPDEIQQILAAADEAGLLGPDAYYGASGIHVYDVAYTTFITTVGGRVHEIGAYALGYGDTDDESLTAARAKLEKFSGEMSSLDVFLGRKISWEPYEPTAIRVFPSSFPTGLTADKVIAWPLDVDPSTGGEPTSYADYRCIVLSGSDLAEFVAAAKTATWKTAWSEGEGSYQVLARPLFPDERGCPPADH
jgi:hypothetical protein